MSATASAQPIPDDQESVIKLNPGGIVRPGPNASVTEHILFIRGVTDKLTKDWQENLWLVWARAESHQQVVNRNDAAIKAAGGVKKYCPLTYGVGAETIRKAYNSRAKHQYVAREALEWYNSPDRKDLNQKADEPRWMVTTDDPISAINQVVKRWSGKDELIPKSEGGGQGSGSGLVDEDEGVILAPESIERAQRVGSDLVVALRAIAARDKHIKVLEGLLRKANPRIKIPTLPLPEDDPTENWVSDYVKYIVGDEEVKDETETDTKPRPPAARKARRKAATKEGD